MYSRSSVVNRYICMYTILDWPRARSSPGSMLIGKWRARARALTRFPLGYVEYHQLCERRQLPQAPNVSDSWSLLKAFARAFLDDRQKLYYTPWTNTPHTCAHYVARTIHQLLNANNNETIPQQKHTNIFVVWAAADSFYINEIRNHKTILLTEHNFSEVWVPIEHVNNQSRL